MTRVAAIEIGYPMVFVILMETNDDALQDSSFAARMMMTWTR